MSGDDNFERWYDLGHGYQAVFAFSMDGTGVSLTYDNAYVADLEISATDLDPKKDLFITRRQDKVEHVSKQYRLARVHFLKEVELVLRGVLLALQWKEEVKSKSNQIRQMQRTLDFRTNFDNAAYKPMSYRDGEWVEYD